nr:MAG TPA: hypothetical protein [Caudoviricetes sp.]
MLGISELYGGEEQVIQRLINNIGFGIHVALPAVVARYQRAIRWGRASNPTVDKQHRLWDSRCSSRCGSELQCSGSDG